MNGVIIRTNLRNIQESYNPLYFKKGLFIETDILSSKVMGTIPTNPSGRITFWPVCGEDVMKNERSYIISLNDWSDDYITLIVPYEYYSEFEEFINDRTSSYHFTGEFERLKGELPYEQISNVTGITDNSEMNKIVSAEYAIRIVDLKKKNSVFINGLSLMCAGFFLILPSINKKDMNF
ncbi:MAG: hypothetical protein PHY47_19035 [Lachnospiraceae bacterium]|nr:hypothetical protein [Lachnospiraceae bacterium]